MQAPASPARARRDLEWLISRAPIIDDARLGHVAWVGSHALSSMRVDLRTALAELPDAALMGALKERRSGRYVEHLLHALLQHVHRFQLLAHDLQVRDKKRTIGAFDFILHDRQREKGLHVELAFKQYLLCGFDPFSMRSWVGPRGRDRLDIKAQHMLERQLCLGDQPAGQAALRAHGVTNYERWALMAGRLFVPLMAFRSQAWPDLPAACCPNLEWGWWASWSQWQQRDDFAGEFFLLPPQFAVAPLEAADCAEFNPANEGQLRDQLAGGVPALVALTSDGNELSRGWIVSDSHQSVNARRSC